MPKNRTISFPGATHMSSRIAVNGIDQSGTFHATGNDFHGTVGTMLIQRLAPGDYSFSPRYRTPSFLGIKTDYDSFLGL
jgi:hypothetical protein